MIAAALVFASLLVPVQTDCTQRHEALGHLGAKYGEKIISFGLANSGQIVSVVVSADGSTWTIIATLPDGCTRIVATGVSWHQIKDLLGEDS